MRVHFCELWSCVKLQKELKLKMQVIQINGFVSWKMKCKQYKFPKMSLYKGRQDRNNESFVDLSYGLTGGGGHLQSKI